MTNGTFGKDELEFLVPWFFALFVLETLLFAHVVFLRRNSARMSRMLASPIPAMAQGVSCNHGVTPKSTIKRPEAGDQVVPQVATPKLVYQHPYGPHAHTQHANLPSIVPKNANAYEKDVEACPSSEQRQPWIPPVVHGSWLSTIDESENAAATAANPAQSAHLPTPRLTTNPHLSWDMSMDTRHSTRSASTTVAFVEPVYGHIRRVEAPLPAPDHLQSPRVDLTGIGNVTEREFASPASAKPRVEVITEPNMQPSPLRTTKTISGVSGVPPSAISNHHHRTRNLPSDRALQQRPPQALQQSRARVNESRGLPAHGSHRPRSDLIELGEPPRARV